MSNALKFSGTLVYVGEVQVIKSRSGKEFVKRDIGIADDPDAQYPTVLIATLKKTQKADNTQIVNSSMINRTCTVSFFPDGRFYTDKNTGAKKAIAGNSVWKIDWSSPADGSSAPEPAEPEDSTFVADQDEMPF